MFGLFDKKETTNGRKPHNRAYLSNLIDERIIDLPARVFFSGHSDPYRFRRLIFTLLYKGLNNETSFLNCFISYVYDESTKEWFWSWDDYAKKIQMTEGMTSITVAYKRYEDLYRDDTKQTRCEYEIQAININQNEINAPDNTKELVERMDKIERKLDSLLQKLDDGEPSID